MSDSDFKYLSQEFSFDLLKLVKQKGVYPYKYMDSSEKDFEDKLPNKCIFFSFLKDECINEKDYSHAIKIWNTFKMITMGNYHDLCLKTDVLLLADVFEKFVNTCLEYYGLDPCHYFSSPGLSWNAIIQMTGIELELNSDIDMHLLTEKGMREDTFSFAKWCSKANNKYMKSYVVNEPSKFIIYLDTINLYNWAMSQYLPYSEFNWLDQKEIDRLDVNSIGESSPIGYILEVVLNILVNYMNFIMSIH